MSHTDPDGRVTHFEHDPLGRIAKVLRPNGTITSQSYDPAGNIVSIEHMGKEGVLSSFAYIYDKVGNRLSQVEEDGAKTTYTYDALYRLTKVAYPIEKIKKIRDTYLAVPNDKSGKEDKDAGGPAKGNGKNRR